jgi:transposase
MFELNTNVRYFICNRPVSMRNSFDGLAGIVRNFMRQSPTSDGVFIFFNNTRTHVKILFWDSSGFVLYYKRLEQGRFQRYTTDCGAYFEIDKAMLTMLMEGIKIDKIQRLKRYKML